MRSLNSGAATGVAKTGAWPVEIQAVKCDARDETPGSRDTGVNVIFEFWQRVMQTDADALFRSRLFRKRL